MFCFVCIQLFISKKQNKKQKDKRSYEIPYSSSLSEIWKKIALPGTAHSSGEYDQCDF